jgi:hypothetical protein
VLRQHGGKFATAPLGGACAVLERILIDEAVEMVCEFARDCARAPRTRPIHQACHAVVRKALPPCAEGRVVKWKVAATALTWWPATTARTACARRKTRASWGCVSTVSHVVSASARKWLWRGRSASLLGGTCSPSHTRPMGMYFLEEQSDYALNFPGSAFCAII